MNKRDEAVLLSFDEEFCLVADNGKERIAILAEWADADLMKKWLIQSSKKRENLDSRPDGRPAEKR